MGAGMEPRWQTSMTYLPRSRRQCSADCLRQRRHAVHDRRHRRPTGRGARAQDRTTSPAKCYGCATMERCPPDNPFVGRSRTSAGDPVEHRSQCVGAGKSSRTPAPSGNARMDPTAATRSTFWKPGKNYGWPVVSYSRFLSRAAQSLKANGARGWSRRWSSGCRAIAISGMTFYTGDKFPNWKNNNVFVGGMRQGEFRDPAIWSASISMTSGRNYTANRCSASCKIGFGTCLPGMKQFALRVDGRKRQKRLMQIEPSAAAEFALTRLWACVYFCVSEGEHFPDSQRLFSSHTCSRSFHVGCSFI